MKGISSQARFQNLFIMLGKPRIRLNNLKTSLEFSCRGLNPLTDSISHSDLLSRQMLIVGPVSKLLQSYV